MADINRIQSGKPIIPPVPQDTPIDERETRKQKEREKKQHRDDENDNNSGRDGIDYYA